MFHFETISGNDNPMAKVKKAIIPAAGLGTRFLPATKTIPKEMLLAFRIVVPLLKD
jgi:UTP-glucose-1-phosphate uridylyltransferase